MQAELHQSLPATHLVQAAPALHGTRNVVTPRPHKVVLGGHDLGGWEGDLGDG